MRAVVLLCLLTAAFGESTDMEYHSWSEYGTHDTNKPHECLTDQSSCGCCLMQKKLQRMESFFHHIFEEVTKCLSKPKMYLFNMRASRSAFSVALNSSSNSCLNSTAEDMTIRYDHVLLNLGEGYSVDTGYFTVPRSGVYSLAVTINSNNSTMNVCAELKVNDEVVAKLSEEKQQDSDDSSTVVASVKLKAGDMVGVNLPEGCAICEHKSHFNTFTGFLVYATD